MLKLLMLGWPLLILVCQLWTGAAALIPVVCVLAFAVGICAGLEIDMSKKTPQEQLRGIRAQLTRIAADAIADGDDALAQRAVWAADALREEPPMLMLSFAGPGKVSLDADCGETERTVTGSRSGRIHLRQGETEEQEAAA